MSEEQHLSNIEQINKTQGKTQNRQFNENRSSCIQEFSIT